MGTHRFPPRHIESPEMLLRRRTRLCVKTRPHLEDRVFDSKAVTNWRMGGGIDAHKAGSWSVWTSRRIADLQRHVGILMSRRLVPINRSFNYCSNFNRALNNITVRSKFWPVVR